MSIAEAPVTRADESSPLDMGAAALQRHALDVLRERLIADFPSASPARVGALLDESYARTEGARVQAFRALLAERDVRRALHDAAEPALSQRRRRPTRPARV
jgi:hypothetical protein